MSDPALQVRGLCGGYGTTQVLFDIDLDVPPNGCVAVLGLNGAGKTTMLNTIMGALPAWEGTVHVGGRETGSLKTDQIVKQGVGYVPQEQPIFSSLTVRDNLLVGASVTGRSTEADLDPMLEFFPKLRVRLGQHAGTLSGGERKMLAIARALIGQPRLLILDEPTEGVWPAVLDEIAERLHDFATSHSVLLVEHNLDFALGIADQAYVLDRGRVAAQGDAATVREDDRALKLLTPSGPAPR